MSNSRLRQRKLITLLDCLKNFNTRMYVLLLSTRIINRQSTLLIEPRPPQIGERDTLIPAFDTFNRNWPMEM